MNLLVSGDCGVEPLIELAELELDEDVGVDGSA